MKRYLWNLLIAIDQLVNAVAGGRPRQTLSARAHRAHLRGNRLGTLTCRLLDHLDPDHCRKAHELP